MKCPQCHQDYTPKGDWQKTCTNCWKQNKQRVETNIPMKRDVETNNSPKRDVQTNILHQCLLKIAGNQLKAKPSELVQYAIQLEIEFNKWSTQ